MNTTLTKTNKLKEQKALALKKKEANIKSIITTVEANPKFIKLLTFSLNSMEALVSPPNYDIRINAKIIIRRKDYTY